MRLKKAALRRFILPAVLRELLLTSCVLKSVVLVHCEETCCCSWSQDSTAVEVACPKRALLIRLATQRECCVTSTSMRCLVFSGLRLRQTRRNSCPSSHNPPIFKFSNFPVFIICARSDWLFSVCGACGCAPEQCTANCKPLDRDAELCDAARKGLVRKTFSNF